VALVEVTGVEQANAVFDRPPERRVLPRPQFVVPPRRVAERRGDARVAGVFVHVSQGDREAGNSIGGAIGRAVFRAGATTVGRDGRDSMHLLRERRPASRPRLRGGTRSRNSRGGRRVLQLRVSFVAHRRGGARNRRVLRVAAGVSVVGGFLVAEQFGGVV